MAVGAAQWARADQRRREHRLLDTALRLFALGVAEPPWGHGVGHTLVAAVEEGARRRGLDGVCVSVATDNVRAVSLHRRLGYERQGSPFVSRWTWYGPDEEEREVVERCYRMVRRFGGGHG